MNRIDNEIHKSSKSNNPENPDSDIMLEFSLAAKKVYKNPQKKAWNKMPR